MKAKLSKDLLRRLASLRDTPDATIIGISVEHVRKWPEVFEVEPPVVTGSPFYKYRETTSFDYPVEWMFNSIDLEFVDDPTSNLTPPSPVA